MVHHVLSIELGADLPRGYRWGAFVGGSVWFLIRNRDGAAIRARTGTDDGCFTAPELPGAIAEAFENVYGIGVELAPNGLSYETWERA